MITSSQSLAQPSLVFIIILNWNQPDDTLDSLRAASLCNYPNFKLLVVDNGSLDQSVSKIRSIYPDLVIIENQRNLGYAAGNNVGIDYALAHGAEYILLLNNDAFIEPDTLSHMVAAIDDSAVAAVGCKVRLMEDPDRLWAAGECFNRGQLPIDDGSFDRPGDIRYAAGCCILVTRMALQMIGLLDEEYFLVHEERDWCYRAVRAGFRIRYAPQAEVRHKVTFTAQWSPGYHYLFVRNQLRLWQRNGIIPVNWRSLRGAFWVWRQETSFIAKYDQHKFARLYGATWGVIDFYRQRFGPPPENLINRQ